MNRMLWSMIAGAAGASALTLIHQTARSMTPHAPRMDVLGMRAVRATHRRLGLPDGSERQVEREAMAGDLVANAAYYALVGAGVSKVSHGSGAAAAEVPNWPPAK